MRNTPAAIDRNVELQRLATSEYLRRLELHSSPNYGTARLLSRIYGCDIKLFLYGERGRTALQKSRQSTTSTPRAVGRR